MPLNSARAGLSPQEGDVSRRKEVDQGRWSVSARRGREKVQEKKETKEGEKVAPRRKGSVCPQPRISFSVHEYLGSERPVSFEVSAPTRLCLQGSHVQRKFRQRTTLRSESSTLKGLLYAPIKQEQYQKDYSTQVEDPAANVVRNVALSPWSVV
jgi:hypothetical protein